MDQPKKTLMKVPKRLLSEEEIEKAKPNTPKSNVQALRAKGKITNVQSGVTSKNTKGRNGYRVHYEGGDHEDIAPEALSTLSKTVDYQNYRRELAKPKK